MVRWNNQSSAFFSRLAESLFHRPFLRGPQLFMTRVDVLTILTSGCCGFSACRMEFSIAVDQALVSIQAL